MYANVISVRKPMGKLFNTSSEKTTQYPLSIYFLNCLNLIFIKLSPPQVVTYPSHKFNVLYVIQVLNV
ncbi:hypothetical protein Hdeb2414_s0025g00669331 [Helianthus debilis subsp. tardiflorus]